MRFGKLAPGQRPECDLNHRPGTPGAAHRPGAAWVTQITEADGRSA